MAYRLGFHYQQHFSKLFKVRTGISPSDFRLVAITNFEVVTVEKIDSVLGKALSRLKNQ
jgi:hypothetical protein